MDNKVELGKCSYLQNYNYITIFTYGNTNTYTQTVE